MLSFSILRVCVLHFWAKRKFVKKLFINVAEKDYRGPISANCILQHFVCILTNTYQMSSTKNLIILCGQKLMKSTPDDKNKNKSSLTSVLNFLNSSKTRLILDQYKKMKCFSSFLNFFFLFFFPEFDYWDPFKRE